MIKINYHITDFLFRLLFSLIFLGLGAEHLFSDELIQRMMPEWFSFKRGLSLGAGIVLLTGGLSILFGYRVKQGAALLIIFLLIVTPTVHGTALIIHPPSLPEDWYWLWDVYQRSNFVKNLCLIGVCLHLVNHKTGKYSLDKILLHRRSRKREKIKRP